MQNDKSTLHRLIVALVALIGLAVSIVCFIWRLNNSAPLSSFVLVAVYYGFIFYYGIHGYKTPHGNMVRYILLTFALYIAFSIVILVERWDSYPWIIFAASNIAAVLIGYMAGRLNKFKKNIIVAVIISALLLVKSFWPLNGADLNSYSLFVLDRTMPLFMWITVMLIYFFRFKDHKQAGIEADTEE